MRWIRRHRSESITLGVLPPHVAKCVRHLARCGSGLQRLFYRVVKIRISTSCCANLFKGLCHNLIVTTALRRCGGFEPWNYKAVCTSVPHAFPRLLVEKYWPLAYQNNSTGNNFHREQFSQGTIQGTEPYLEESHLDSFMTKTVLKAMLLMLR